MIQKLHNVHRMTRILLGLTATSVLLGGGACRLNQKAETPAKTAKNAADEAPLAIAADSSASEIPRPMPEPTLAELRGRIEAADGYPARIEARRVLLHCLRKDGQREAAMAELQAVLDDVELHENRPMAMRVAFSEAGNLLEHKDYRTALGAYELLLERYPDSSFAPDALMLMGTCHLDIGQYAQAEAMWQRLIEQHEGTPQAPWGWRKMALAQLLQGRFEESLSTLGIMAEKYAGTEFADYAKMRRGYVLMAADRCDEARAAYTQFLTECADSKYCRLAQTQLDELDHSSALARANGRRAGVD